MQNAIFNTKTSDDDTVVQSLSKISRIVLVLSFGLAPLFFIPVGFAPFGFTKVVLVIFGVFTAIVFYSLAALRSGSLSVRRSWIFFTPWILAGAVVLSALFSGDTYDALVGSGFSVHTAVFVSLLALIISIVPILGREKSSLMNLYMILALVGISLGIYHLLRLVFGVDFLSFGIFQSITSTPLGGWNDLAIFFGLSLLLALVTIEQFPLTKFGRSIFILASLISLTILAIVNFFAIWVVLGFISLVVLMYALTKNRFRSNALTLEKENSFGTLYSVILSSAVFTCAIVFIIGGSALSARVSEVTNISFVEVRPSLSATLDIARGTFRDNAFTGIGANKFSDAWRLYKDPSINQTIFWNTPFQAGVGYIPTFLVTTGIVGVLAWLGFLVAVLYAGFKILLTVRHVDRFWYFMGTSSFVSALYLWGVSLIYVPGPATLILAAVFTGILFTTFVATIPQKTFTIAFGEDRRTGFALVALTMLVIVGSVSAIYFTVQQYGAQYRFNEAISSVTPGTDIDELEKRIARSYELAADDRFAREITLLQLAKMNSLLGVPEPTDVQLEQYRTIVANAVRSGQIATQLDQSDPRNWQALGAVYSLLIATKDDEAYSRATQALKTAALYDPVNPEIQLQFAQMESRIGNLDAAREYVREAIRLKNNYTQAYFLAAQIDIARGDLPAAIASAQSVATLEPQNPARFYQLGILHSSNNDLANATAAFEQAVRIDPGYANARYFLALAYSQQGRVDDAKTQLEVVRDLNPENAVVGSLITELENGGVIGEVTTANEIDQTETESADGTTVEAESVPDSPLLTPVNTVPDSSDTEEDEITEETNETLE